MELSESELREIRMLPDCQRMDSHHEWLHRRLRMLVEDFDAVTLIARTAAPFAPLEAFEKREADIVQIHASRR